MLVNSLILCILVLGVLLLAVMPWVFCYVAWQEGSEDVGPITTIISAGICLFEVAAVIDWAFGF